MGTSIFTVHNRHWWGSSINRTWKTAKDVYQRSGKAPPITFRSIIASEVVAEFSPFITNFSDNWNSDWASEHVFGRSDPIYQWRSTGRSISLGFKVVAQSYNEAYVNMCNISKLTRMLYPYYEQNSVALATAVSKAPLVRIRWANLLMNSQHAEWTDGQGDGGQYHEHGL